MNFFKNLTLILPLAAMGCSEVSFAPGDDGSSIRLSDGDGAKQHEEFFVQKSGGAAADLLIVVDNSGSMAQEQEKMGVRIASFLSHINDVDWQLGITTTDMTSGPWGTRGGLLDFGGTRVLTKYVPDYETKFLNTVVRNETLNCSSSCPSANEQPLRAIESAILKHDTENRGFFRNDTDFVVLILSDEDENSNGSGAMDPGLVYDTFSSTFGETKAMYGYGIITQPGDTACYSAQSSAGGNYGNFIAEFVNLSQGLLGSICDEDYGDVLSEMGQRVRRLLDFIELAHKPQPESVKILFKPKQPDISYEVLGKRVVFNKAPPEGTEMFVFYNEWEEAQEFAGP